jgi:hypothetical protein
MTIAYKASVKISSDTHMERVLCPVPPNHISSNPQLGSPMYQIPYSSLLPHSLTLLPSGFEMPFNITNTFQITTLPEHPLAIFPHCRTDTDDVFDFKLEPPESSFPLLDVKCTHQSLLEGGSSLTIFKTGT